MKKRYLASLLPFALVLPMLFVQNNTKQVEAATPTYNIPLEAGEELDYENEIYDGFGNGIDSNRWYIREKTWGQTGARENGGVVSDNVFYNASEGTAILRTTGDQYAEKNITAGPNAKSPNGRRTGADLVLKQFTYPGRYEVRMKVAPRYGACSSLWTYIEYSEKNADGDHHNHEIDIELPWHGDFKQISYGTYKSLSKHTSVKYQHDKPLNDNEYHTYGFDWYYNENTGNKLINFYVDGVVTTITSNIPFYKTKVNLGVWIPNSELAGAIPAFDQAYMDIDYFRYIPFKNNVHMDSDYAKSYDMSTGVADLNEYPSNSTPIPDSERNYFPNGTFNYVNKRVSSDWLDESITGLATTNAEVLKKTYDYNNSSTSGGIKLNNGGTLSATIDSCHKNQNYVFSANYKGNGNAYIDYYSQNDVLLDTTTFSLNNSANWTEFREDVAMIDNVSYIKVRFDGGENTLTLDNIYLTLDSVEPEIEDETTNHFMTAFYGNESVLNTFSTTKDASSSRIENAVLDKADVTSNINWKSNSAKYEYKSGSKPDYCASITIGQAEGNATIQGSADATYSSIYNAVSESEALTGYQSVIYSTSAISNLRDISLAWGSCESGSIYIVYKLKGESTWKYLTKFSGTTANIGSNNKASWNRRQLLVDNNDASFSSKLLGKTAQIGFMYSSNASGNATNYLRINAIIVNKIKSIEAKINYWSEEESNLCGTSGSLFDEKSLDYADLYLTNFNLTTTQADELNTPFVSSSDQREATYYNQFAFLCNKANISVTISPSLNSLGFVDFDSDEGIHSMLVVIITVFAIASITSMLIIYKKKRNN